MKPKEYMGLSQEIVRVISLGNFSPGEKISRKWHCDDYEKAYQVMAVMGYDRPKCAKHLTCPSCE